MPADPENRETANLRPGTRSGTGPARRGVAKAFGRAASGYEAADFLHREVRGRLLERLDFVSLTPAVVLDLGAGPPSATAELQTRFPTSQLIAADLVVAMLGPAGTPWHRLGADAARLPLPDQSVDLVVAGMLLHWCENPEAVLTEVRRILRYPGLLLLSTLGPDTLRELRTAWLAVDEHRHTLAFADMHNLGDSLVRCGFAEPVVDSDKLTVSYRDLSGLVRDLRGVGATDLSPDRRRTLTGRGRWAAWLERFNQQRRADGSWSVTLEVICGHAWASPPGAGRATTPGEFAVPLQALRRRP